MFLSDKTRIKFIFSFKCKYKIRKNELIISCNNCIDMFRNIFSYGDSFDDFLIEEQDISFVTTQKLEKRKRKL